MATAFQADAFQSDQLAFQIEVVAHRRRGALLKRIAKRREEELYYEPPKPPPPQPGITLAEVAPPTPQRSMEALAVAAVTPLQPEQIELAPAPLAPPRVVQPVVPAVDMEAENQKAIALLLLAVGGQ